MGGEFIEDPGTGELYFVDDAGFWYVPDAMGNYQPVQSPGVSSTSDWAKVIADSAAALAQGYLTYEQQKAYLKENARRAQLNQKLLSPQEWGTLGTVQVSADAQTRNIMLVAAAGLGILALMALRRR
jgi:hypothetical protein